MIGATVGSYEIISQIGKGGMGVVYRGRHSILGRPAAIKVLLPELSQRREIVARFFNEARAATAIRHPGIVEIYDFGFLPDGAGYLAMEFLEGESLGARLERERRLSVVSVVQIGRQIAAALQAAHGKGITHRDLKPDNVFLVRDPEIGERVKLLDFGIAKLASEDPGGSGSGTSTGMIIGTPAYMSPEQCRGTSTVDGRSDLYSLGCILYELLAGRPVFQADGASELLAHHLYFQPEPVRVHNPSVPEPLEWLIHALLNKDPAMRPATATDVMAVLDQLATWPIVLSSAANPTAPPRLPPYPPPRLSTDPRRTTGGASAGEVVAVRPARPRASRALWIAGPAIAAVVIGVVFLRAGSRPTTSPAPLMAAQPSPPIPSVSTPSAANPPQAASPPSVANPPSATAPAIAPAASPIATSPAPATTPTGRPHPEPPIAPAAGQPHKAAAAPDKPAKHVRSTATTREATPIEPTAAAAAPLEPAAPPAPPPAAPAPAPAPVVPAPASAPPPAPAAVAPGSLDAVSSIASVNVDGPLPDSEIRAMVERALDTFRECYRSAAQQANQTPKLQIALSFVVDEGRAVRNVRVSGDALGLGACVKEAAAKIRTRVAPDVGTASVKVVVRFQPTR
jgi:serine/threonine-protein kinase